MAFRWAIVLPTAGLIGLLGMGQLAYYGVALGYAFLEGAFVYLVGRRLAGWPVGLAAAALLAVHPIAVDDGSMLLPDHAINAWVTMAVWGLLRPVGARGRGGQIAWAALAGLFCLGAYLSRLSSLLLAPVLLLVLRRRRFLLPLIVLAAVFLLGVAVEGGVYAHFTGDPLRRFQGTSASYEHWEQRTELAAWGQLVTRWKVAFEGGFGSPWVVAAPGVACLGLLLFGGRRGRLIGVWYLLPTLLVLFMIRDIHPIVPLLPPNLRYLAPAAAPAALGAAFLGVSLCRAVGRWKPLFSAVGQVLGTVLLCAACICVLTVQQRTRDTDTGHPWRLVGRVEREIADTPDGRVYANNRAELMARLLGSDRLRERLASLRRILASGDPLPPGSLVFADLANLRYQDLKHWNPAPDAADDSAGRPRVLVSDRVEWAPPHWRLLEAGSLRRQGYYVLYRVLAPGARPGSAVRLNRRSAPGFWAADADRLEGWHLHTTGGVSVRPIAGPDPARPALRMHRTNTQTSYLLTGGSEDLDNLRDARVTPEQVDRIRVRADRLYQLRLRARLHSAEDRPVMVLLRLYQFGPRHLVTTKHMRWTYKLPLRVTPCERLDGPLAEPPWQSASLAFRVRPDAQFLRIGFALSAPGVLDLADVQLLAF
jgi:hypothetical protein